MSYFVFGCVMLGAHHWRSGWQYALALLLANIALLAFARWLGYPWSALVWMPVTTLVVGLIVHVERQRQRKDAALRLSQDEVRRLAATAERERIGRDLHDLLGHTLSLVALKADLAGRLLESDPRAAQREIGELGARSRAMRWRRCDARSPASVPRGWRPNWPRRKCYCRARAWRCPSTRTRTNCRRRRKPCWPCACARR